MPVGTPIGRSSGPLNIPGAPPPGANMPGGLSIGQSPNKSIKDDDDPGDEDEAAHGGRASSGDKRRRRASSVTAGGTASSLTGQLLIFLAGSSPHSLNSAIPPPALSIPQGGPGPASAQGHPSSATGSMPNQISLGQTPTSPQQQHSSIPNASQNYSTSYGGHPPPQHHQQQGEASPIYGGAHMIPPSNYTYGPSGQAGQQQMGSLAAAQHGHWAPQQQVQQGQHYGRR